MEEPREDAIPRYPHKSHSIISNLKGVLFCWENRGERSGQGCIPSPSKAAVIIH